VIASERASFALPEVKRGVFAKAGALGRIIRFLGPTSPPSSLLFNHLPIISALAPLLLSTFHFIPDFFGGLGRVS